MLAGDNAYSYVNESLGHQSLIDHMFISDTLYGSLVDLRIINDPCNLSDHLPVVGKLKVDTHVPAQLHTTVSRRNKQLFKTRWDKCNLNDYYCCTDTALRNVEVPVDCFVCPSGCECVDHRISIDNYYNGIVQALHFAACHTVPVMSCSALKAFWSVELDSLKSDSVFWHNVWNEAGRPSNGILHRIKTSCKLKYKLAIKEAFTAYDHANSDELAHHFLNKNIPDFWKTWNKRFSKNLASHMTIDGHSDDSEIAQVFADKFCSVFYDSDCNMSATQEYVDEFRRVSNSKGFEYEHCVSRIDVALVDECICDLRRGKASGPDDISAEHLQFAHPSLVMHIKMLIQLIFQHGYVPDGFGLGLIIPLVKDKSGNLNNSDNYTAITIGPVIAKVMDEVILKLCQDNLCTDDLQFGFKQGLGCTNAVFLCRSTVDHFTHRGSNVYAATLDIKKAFDRVNHYKLFVSLLKVGVPLCIIAVLADWYSKMFVMVKWNGCTSDWFPVRSGVRQGSVLSPNLLMCL